MQYNNCTLQNSWGNPVQRRIVKFLIRSNATRLVSVSLTSVLICVIHYHLQSTIVLHLKVNIYVMNTRWCYTSMLSVLVNTLQLYFVKCPTSKELMENSVNTEQGMVMKKVGHSEHFAHV